MRSRVRSGSRMTLWGCARRGVMIAMQLVTVQILTRTLRGRKARRAAAVAAANDRLAAAARESGRLGGAAERGLRAIRVGVGPRGSDHELVTSRYARQHGGPNLGQK